MINKMDDRDSFGYCVAGFVSGEGSFFVVLLGRPGRRPQAHSGFSIRVRADDAELVRSIWRALGYPGAVHSVPPHRYQYANDSVRRHDATMLIVRSRTELIGQVIPFFDRYSLRGVKRRNYDL